MTTKSTLGGCRLHAVSAQSVEERWINAERQQADDTSCICCWGPTVRGRLVGDFLCDQCK